MCVSGNPVSNPPPTAQIFFGDGRDAKMLKESSENGDVAAEFLVPETLHARGLLTAAAISCAQHGRLHTTNGVTVALISRDCFRSQRTEPNLRAYFLKTASQSFDFLLLLCGGDLEIVSQACES
jgi:hypothetical protein